jgi:hypothetical protein
MPEDTVANTVVANKEHSSQENQTADGARLSDEKKSGQIENNEHCMVVYESWI